MQITTPDIGVDKAVVAEILVKVGDTIAVDDSVVLLESDKASVEVPSTSAGVVKSILVNLGDPVAEGAALIELEAEGQLKRQQYKHRLTLYKLKKRLHPLLLLKRLHPLRLQHHKWLMCKCQILVWKKQPLVKFWCRLAIKLTSIKASSWLSQTKRLWKYRVRFQAQWNQLAFKLVTVLKKA